MQIQNMQQKSFLGNCIYDKNFLWKTLLQDGVNNPDDLIRIEEGCKYIQEKSKSAIPDSETLRIIYMPKFVLRALDPSTSTLSGEIHIYNDKDVSPEGYNPSMVPIAQACTNGYGFERALVNQIKAHYEYEAYRAKLAQTGK